MRMRANNTALKKLAHTVDTWQDRGAVDKYIDLFTGDLAVLCVESFLIKNGLPRESVIIYDVYRVVKGVDPEFKYPGKWDIMVCSNIKLEVKSSIEKYSPNLSVIVKRRRIIAYPGREKEVDIYVQVFYIPEPLDIGWRLEDPRELSLDDARELLTRLDKAYLMGWATREDLEKRTVISIIGRTSRERSRDYRNLRIEEARPMDDLIRYLKLRCHG